MFDTTQLKLYDHTQGPRKVGPDEGYSVQLPGVGVRFMAWTEETGGGFSMVEHPIAPRTMAAPWHMHTREDEYSYVLEGRLGALLGDDEVYAEPGDFVFKPREPVAHVLERRRRAMPDPRDHRSGRVRAHVPRDGRADERAGPRDTGRLQ